MKTESAAERPAGFVLLVTMIVLVVLASLTVGLAVLGLGVVVAVRGTSDARFVAGQLAIFANQAA